MSVVQIRDKPDALPATSEANSSMSSQRACRSKLLFQQRIETVHQIETTDVQRLSTAQSNLVENDQAHSQSA